MRIASVLEDGKVSAKSLMIEISIRDYLSLAKQIYKKNEFQRKRVRSSSSRSIYSLLKNDLIDGCVIPPIVLAYPKPSGTLENDLEGAVGGDADSFVLLDGLQRTITLMEVEAETALQPKTHNDFLDRTIRCEIYEGINKLGILYRMLTLNTGQTAMSVRHQIEILYLDFLNVQIEGVELVRETEGRRARQPNAYNFKDAIEGFNSYLERSESPLDRGDILDNISSLENLAKENDGRDIFRDFIATWHTFITKIASFDLRHPSISEEDDLEEQDTMRIWGSTGVQIFKKGQAISGFGAAIGLLRDEDPSISFELLEIEDIKVGSEHDLFMQSFNEHIALINSKAKRIGNAQRLFFRQFFKMLFWKESGCYLNLSKALVEAYTSTNRIGI